MPRVTAAYRDARREQIALAALRCLRRSGIANTTMADIIEESGLSAGAIYSHFRNKAELAGFVASTLVGGRVGDIVRGSGEEMRAGGDPVSPAQVLARLLPSLERNDVPFEVVLELWGEATRDPAMNDVVRSTVATMRETFATAIRPWLVARLGRDPRAEEMDAATLAMATLCQGWIARLALFGPQDPRELIAGVEAVFG
jgi:AcrR family transcriptional regulator